MIRVFGEVVRAQMRQHGPSARRVRMVNAELERTESSLILIGGKIVGSLDQDVFEGYRRFSACLREELAPVLTDLGMHVIGSEPNARHEGADGCHFLRIAAWRSIDALRQAPFRDTATARYCHHRVSGEADTWALPVQVANEVTADLAARGGTVGRSSDGPARTDARFAGRTSTRGTAPADEQLTLWGE